MRRRADTPTQQFKSIFADLLLIVAVLFQVSECVKIHSER